MVDNGHSSWRTKLWTKFKNLHRPSRAEKAGIMIPPPIKKMKHHSADTIPPPQCVSDGAVYEKHVLFLQRSFKSKKYSFSSLITILEETSLLRSAWIRNDLPSVKQILDKFPCFTEPRMMMKEFCSLTGAEEGGIGESWSKYMAAVFKYAPLETKKVVKLLLRQYLLEEDGSEDRTAVYTLQLLTAFLTSNKMKGQPLLTIFEGESIDVEDAISGLEETAPCIVAFGATSDSISDVKVVIEKQNIMSMPNVTTALHFCFSSYYVFNISFPFSFKPILLFLEKYVYCLKSSDKLPMCVIQTHDCMERL